MKEREHMQKITLLLFVLITNLFLLLSLQAQQVDSMVWKASEKYDNPSVFKRFFLGKNYRKEWETPVKLPVFRLSSMDLKITELGGGNQTKSLSFDDKQGREWVLRTIDKDVEKALPQSLRNTLAEKVVQDMVSAAHPYAPVTISPLAKALGIIAPDPVIYYVPDDPAFGEYRSIFANTVCLLERKEPTPDDSDTKNTFKMFEDILDKNDELITQPTVLKARLLDMLIADWDRHADQWRWGKEEKDDVEYYYAIPRDRDQAYFYSKGLLVKVARIVSAKHFVGFRDDLKKLKNLNFKSWKFDKLFMNSLDAKQWDSTIRWVQARLTDQVIHEAMLQMPPEVYNISGPVMEEKLINRRDELLEKGMKYYRFLARAAIINGTNEEELFRVSGTNDNLKVEVFAWKDNKAERKIYERSFNREETYSIQFNGFDGNDRFEVAEGTNSKIRLLFSGGKGDDIYTIKGHVRERITDEEGNDERVI
jgi:hypothetical protein